MDDYERNHIKTFDCHGEQNTPCLQWKRWLTAFELFADGKVVVSIAFIRAQVAHRAGA